MTAESDERGQITWQTSYEAFGRRPRSVGGSLSRQRANTKEEDPARLLCEGFRYRDLETGVFITRDPAGFIDGPNLYAYVNQNPWTCFDPQGLWSWNEFRNDADMVLGGTLQGWGESNGASTANRLRYEPGTYRTGLAAGHALGIAQGIVEGHFGGGMMAGGGAIMAGGTVASGTVVAAPVSVPVAAGGGALVVGGAAVTAHGVLVAANSTAWLLKDAGDAITGSNPGGQSAKQTRAVQEGEVGTYGGLKSRSPTGDGLDIHEVPSSAAQIAAKENELGRKLTPQELKDLKEQNPSIAIRLETHRLTDTYKGRNTSRMIANDASNLSAAAERGANDVINAGQKTGADLTKQASELREMTK